jgi:hypothetical protein
MQRLIIMKGNRYRDIIIHYHNIFSMNSHPKMHSWQLSDI